MVYNPACVPGAGSGVLDGCEQPLESSPWAAPWEMPWSGPPGLSGNATGLVVHGHLAGLAVFFTRPWWKQRQSPLGPWLWLPFSLTMHVLHCSVWVLSQDGKMGCSALKTDGVRSSLGIILPAEGPVWITLALSFNESSLPKVMPHGGGRSRGLSSLHPPEAPPLPGPCTASWAGVSPLSAGGCFRVYWHTWHPSW